MDSVTVPEWLTNDFLKICLQSDEENFKQVKVKGFSAESAVPAGNNYSSQILRVKVRLDPHDKELLLIVKAPIVGGHLESFDDETIAAMYAKEPIFYNDYITETNKLSKHDIVPKHYTSPNPLCLVMEDLKALGYVMVDRHKLLDFPHCQFYVESSAKLHALSIAVNKKNPELIQRLVAETPKMKKAVEQFFKPMMERGLMCLGAYLEGETKYCKQWNTIKKLLEGDKLWKIYKNMDEMDFPIKALTQLDPWCANMMFKYDDSGKVTNIKLLDFQNPKLTSPLKEFVSFIWVSVNPDMQETKLNDLYHLYCDSLNKNLAELGCHERLTFEAMMEEITHLAPLIIMICSAMLPICIADTVVDMNGFFTEELSYDSIKGSSVYKWYVSSTFKKICPTILDKLTEKGVFHYLEKKVKEIEG